MAWLVSEDNALKRHLQGVKVFDEHSGPSGRPVQVKFGMPDAELSKQNFPMLILDLIDIAEAPERRTYGVVEKMTYRPEGVLDPPANSMYQPPMPDPYDLTYQITSWSRHPRHDRQLLGVVGAELLPPRGGTLYVTEDSTARRLDRAGFSKRDTTDENGKRLFRNVWTVRVSSEIWPFQLTALRLAYSGVTLNDPASLPDAPTTFDQQFVLAQYP